MPSRIGTDSLNNFHEIPLPWLFILCLSLAMWFVIGGFSYVLIVAIGG